VWRLALADGACSDVRMANNQARLKQAESALEQGDPKEALRLAQKAAQGALSVGESLLVAYLQAGALEMMGELETASDVVAEALSRPGAKPEERAPVLEMAAGLALQGGDLLKAAVHLEALVEDDTAEDEAFLTLASVQAALGRHPEAVDAARAYLTSNHTDVEGWCQLTASLLALGLLQEALEAASRAAEVAPDSSAAALNLGVALQQSGAAHKAVVKALDRALKLDSENVDALAAWALAHQEARVAGQKEAASWDRIIERLEKARALEPDGPQWSWHLGRAWLLAGSPEKAQALAGNEATPAARALGTLARAFSSHTTPAQDDPGNHVWSGSVAVDSAALAEQVRAFDLSTPAAPGSQSGAASASPDAANVESAGTNAADAESATGELSPAGAPVARAQAADAAAPEARAPAPASSVEDLAAQEATQETTQEAAQEGARDIGVLPAEGVLAELRDAVVAAVSGRPASLIDSKSAPLPAALQLDQPFSVHLRGLMVEPNAKRGPRIEPAAQICGVYWASVRPGQNEGAGALVLGEPDLPLPADHVATVHAVKPKEGELVLFPSHIFQSLQPAPDARIAVLVDVVPG